MDRIIQFATYATHPRFDIGFRPSAAPAAAQQEIRFWHAMGGALGETLDALVQRFNDSQKEFRVVAEHKGSYEDTMIGALAAQRARRAGRTWCRSTRSAPRR